MIYFLPKLKLCGKNCDLSLKNFHWYFLLVKEKVGRNFQRHLAVGENCWWNSQRHFSWERKKCRWKFSAALWLRENMSVEISSDILAVTEKKCRWKFPATFQLWEKNVGEVSSDVLADRKLAVEVSSDILAVRENAGGNFQRHFSFERKLYIQSKCPVGTSIVSS